MYVDPVAMYERAPKACDPESQLRGEMCAWGGVPTVAKAGAEGAHAMS